MYANPGMSDVDFDLLLKEQFSVTDEDYADIIMQNAFMAGGAGAGGGEGPSFVAELMRQADRVYPHESNAQQQQQQSQQQSQQQQSQQQSQQQQQQQQSQQQQQQQQVHHDRYPQQPYAPPPASAVQPSCNSGVTTRRQCRHGQPGELTLPEAAAPLPPADAAAAARPKRVRRTTTAQREAHKRFRERRKNQMESLAEEVAQKQQQVLQLQQEQHTLSSRLRALERLLQSGEYHMHFLTQRMGGLAVAEASSQQHQQQQQLLQLPSQQQPQQQQQSQQQPQPQQDFEWVGSSCQAMSDATGSERAGRVTASGESVGGLCRAASGSSSCSCCLCASGSGAAEEEVAAFATGATADAETALPAAAAGEEKGNGDASEDDACGARSLKMLLGGGEGGGWCGGDVGRLRGSGALTKQLQQHQRGFGFLKEAGWRSDSRSGGYLVPKTARTAAADAAAAAAMRMDGWHKAVVEMGAHYKEFLSKVAPLVLAAKNSSWREAELSGQVVSLREQMIQRLMHFGMTHRMPIYLAHTLNLETGQVQQEAPQGHWHQVMLLLTVSLPPPVLQEILSMRQLHSSIMERIRQDRQQLIQQLQEVLNTWSGDSRATDEQMSSLAGPHAAGELLLSAIDSNLRREYILEGCLSRALTHILPPLVTAEICVQSYPFWPDLNVITRELEIWNQQQQERQGRGAHQQQQQQEQEAEEGEGKAAAARGGGHRKARNQQQQQQQQQGECGGPQRQGGALPRAVRQQQQHHQQQQQQGQLPGLRQGPGAAAPPAGHWGVPILAAAAAAPASGPIPCGLY